MPSTYITSQDDSVDWICWKQYGRYRLGAVEAVLEANPGLAGYGAYLPAGLTLTLPDLPRQQFQIDPIKLWD